MGGLIDSSHADAHNLAALSKRAARIAELEEQLATEHRQSREHVQQIQGVLDEQREQLERLSSRSQALEQNLALVPLAQDEADAGPHLHAAPQQARGHGTPENHELGICKPPTAAGQGTGNLLPTLGQGRCPWAESSGEGRHFDAPKSARLDEVEEPQTRGRVQGEHRTNHTTSAGERE